MIIGRGSPGYTLFDSYGLTQVRCVDSGSLVLSPIRVTPNRLVAAGYYDVALETLVLIAR